MVSLSLSLHCFSQCLKIIRICNTFFFFFFGVKFCQASYDFPTSTDNHRFSDMQNVWGCCVNHPLGFPSATPTRQIHTFVSELEVRTVNYQ